MKTFATIVSLYVAIGLLITTTNAQDGEVSARIEIPNDAVGHVCEIVREMSNDKSTVQNREQIAGKILRFDDKAVVLVDASRKVRVQRGLPILNRIPYVNRMFMNTAIVDEKLQGELAINRSEIRSIKVVK